MAKIHLNARQQQILAGTFDPTDLRRRYHEARIAWNDMRRVRKECALCGRKLKKTEGHACKRCIALRRERQARLHSRLSSCVHGRLRRECSRKWATAVLLARRGAGW
jgi:hypothetical protein